MDMEDLITKARKPYTITKQRERWTSDEHDKFLEAIKLYGRAWQRIEEHIGTKTAVQIRSHAQKFFSKLEKEAIVKGVPLGQARDIDIPPPRPKRKPNNPYPRKTSAGTPNSVSVEQKDGIFFSSASSSYSRKQIQDPEIDIHFEKSCKKTRGEENFDEDINSGILNLSQETSCTSLSSSSKSRLVTAQLTKQCVFRDYIPLVKETSKKGVTAEVFPNADLDGNQKLDRTGANCTDLDDGMSGAPTLNNYPDNMDEEVTKGEKMQQPEDIRKLLKEELQSNQNYPRHIPVHVVESSSEICTRSSSRGIKHSSSIIHQVETTLRTETNFTDLTASTAECSTISHQQSLSSIPAPLNPFTNKNNSCNTFVNTDMSKLIVSSLLQNPAAHAAASFVASLWPFTNEAAANSTPAPSPSASAIAAATVMAASAWWAAHGLLPLSPPIHPGFSCIPTPVIPSSTDASQILVAKEKHDKKSKAPPGEGQLLDREVPKGLGPKLLDGKSSHMCSLDNHRNESATPNNTEQEAGSSELKPAPPAGLPESGKGGKKELVERSSCGSNTPSSSDVETDKLEKCADGKDEMKELNLNHWMSELNNHRNRSTNIMNESWREVSQEGKLAFKALFSRERLPQSFSPPKCIEDYQLMKGDELHKADGNTGQVDLNSKAFLACLDCQKTEIRGSDRRDNSTDKGPLSEECVHVKFRSCRTGFKPYKRCSLEVKESSLTNGSNQSEGRDPKRLCVEGETST